jgi:hypothetical protein
MTALIIAFVAGLIIGGNLGVLVAALCVAAARSEVEP